MNTGVLALLEVLLVFGGALAVALHQLYRLRADKNRNQKAKQVRAPEAESPPD